MVKDRVTSTLRIECGVCKLYHKVFNTQVENCIRLRYFVHELKYRCRLHKLRRETTK